MSDLRSEILSWLDEQEKLCAAATPGPWIAKQDRDDSARTDDILAPNDPGSEHGYTGRVVITDSGVYPPDWPTAVFIASAREVMPLALAALRGEIETHAPRREPEGWECGDCREALDGGACCETIERIHAATVGAAIGSDASKDGPTPVTRVS